jgi:hypothetical protein
MNEAELRAAILRVAAEQPERWASVGVALLGGASDHGDAKDSAPAEAAAPKLPHDDQEEAEEKIIQLDHFRRSAG